MENINRRPSLHGAIASSLEQVIERVKQTTELIGTLTARGGETDEQGRKRVTKSLVKSGYYNRLRITPDQVYPQDYSNPMNKTFDVIK